MQEKFKSKRVIEAVIIIILLLPIILTFGTNMLFYKNSAAPEFMGKYYIYINDKENMNNIPKNTAVICEKTDVESIEVNNVILATVNPEDDKAILRVVDMDEDTYTLKSDFADESLDEPIEDSLVINKENAMAICRWTSNGFGKFVAFATSNAGIVTLIVLPCTIIVLILASCILEKDKSPEDKTERERKAREKKEKAEAKRQKLIDKNNEKSDETYTEDDDISEENQKINIADIMSDVPEDEEEKENESETEDKAVAAPPVKTINEDEYAAVQKSVEAKIAAAEKISITKFEAAALEEQKELQISSSDKTEEIEIPESHPDVDNVEIPKIIKSENVNVVEAKIEKTDISGTESTVEPIKKAETSVHTSKPKNKPAAVKKPSANNKYASNKYSAAAAKRNAASKSSIDDLLKTIDSEKSKFKK